MPINFKFYEPLVKEFCAYAESFDERSYPPFGLFVPYTFERYQDATHKLFYVGLDTAGWISFSEMMADFKSGNIHDYLKKNSEVVTVQGENKDGTDKHSLKENWYYGRGFWQFCQKLQLYISTGKIYDSLYDLSPSDYSIIEEIGYANTNSLETQQTLYRRGYWYDIENQYGYWKLKEFSSNLNSFANLLEAYSPDVIIVFNWGFSESILDGLITSVIEYIDDLLRIRRIRNNNTVIIETCHPSRMKYLGVSEEEMIHLIGDKVKSFF